MNKLSLIICCYLMAPIISWEEATPECDPSVNDSKCSTPTVPTVLSTEWSSNCPKCPDTSSTLATPLSSMSNDAFPYFSLSDATSPSLSPMSNSTYPSLSLSNAASPSLSLSETSSSTVFRMS